MIKRYKTSIITAFLFSVVLPVLYILCADLDMGGAQLFLLIPYILPGVLLLLFPAVLGIISRDNNPFFEGFISLNPVAPQGYLFCSFSWIALIFAFQFFANRKPN